MQGATSCSTTLVHQTMQSSGIPPNHHQLAFNHQELEHKQSVKNIPPLQIQPPSGNKLGNK